jgi:hypothetical protein
MGLFLPAPQLLESMFLGMNHGVEAANAVGLCKNLKMNIMCVRGTLPTVTPQKREAYYYSKSFSQCY